MLTSLRRLTLFLICLLSVPTLAMAQPDDDLEAKLGAGLHFGTTGIGAHVGYRIAPWLTARGTFDYLGYDLGDIELDEDINADFEINMTSVGLLADIHPFPKSSFKVFTGAMFYLSNELTATGRYAGGTSVTLDNGLVVNGSSLGEVKLTVEQSSSIAPVVGIGIGRVVPKRRVGFGVDLGAIFWSGWDAKITSNNPFYTGQLDNEAAQISEDADALSIWPFLNFNLTIRLL